MRNQWISFRLTSDEAIEVTRSANAAGMAPGPHMRAMALSAMRGRHAAADFPDISARLDAIREAVDSLNLSIDDRVKAAAAGAGADVYEARTRPALQKLADALKAVLAKPEENSK